MASKTMYLILHQLKEKMTKTEQIRRDYKKQKKKNISALARKYGVTRQTIYAYIKSLTKQK
jgi:Mor family transcriptional regulator